VKKAPQRYKKILGATNSLTIFLKSPSNQPNKL